MNMVKSTSYTKNKIENNGLFGLYKLYVIWRKMKNKKILKRKRIENALNNIFEYPLTIVSATMGYGKTTSVRTFLNSHHFNVIWASMTGSQGVENLLWKKLCDSVEMVFPETGKKLKELGFPVDIYQISKIIDFIKTTITDKQTVIVIDDYHLMEDNKQINTILELIVQEEISDLHIVIISRTRPNFNHANLLAKGLCYYVDSGTLAFTYEEIEAYFKFMEFPLTQKDLEGVQEYTVGWISAIYLVMLGMKEGLNTVSNVSIAQLLEDTLFNQLDPAAQKTVLSLSIFDNFTIRQASMILENNSIRQIVKLLVDKNAFIEYDPFTGSFKLHNIFLDYLRSKLETSTIDMKPVYYRAGQWYTKLGDYITAFDFYHRAGRLQELLEYLNNLETVKISFLGNDMMQKICNEIPQHLCIKYPILFLQVALNFIFSGEEVLVGQGMSIVHLVRDFYKENEGFSAEFRDRVFAELEVINGILSFNDLKIMLEHARKAKELFHGGKSSMILSSSEFTFGLPHFLYSYYREPGQLQETVEYIVDGFPLPFLDGCGTGCEYLALAEYAYAIGDVEQAGLYARKAIYKSRTKMQVSIELSADFTLMRLYLLEGKKEEAKELLKKARQMLLETKSKLSMQSNIIFNTTMDLCEGYIYGCMGLLDFMPDWLRNGDFSSAAYMFQGLAFSDIIHAKAVLLSGNWIKLEILCESFHEKYNQIRNQFGLIHISIYESIAKYKLYGMEVGLKVLLPALKDAQADRILMPLAENADNLLPMLENIKEEDGLYPSYLNDLICLSNKYSKNIRKEDKETAVLTEREIQVLHLIAEGMTKKEIAEQLVVSLSTVKRHLENIYQKLDVNNKIAAIKSAKELKLV